jgi:hypothetical protein
MTADPEAMDRRALVAAVLFCVLVWIAAVGTIAFAVAWGMVLADRIDRSLHPELYPVAWEDMPMSSECDIAIGDE